MKRIAVTLFITIITCLFATAGDVIKVLRVYSGGEYTTIPLSGIDSLAHSKYDSDGILHNEHVSSIVHAIDRDYQMSINNIDSIVVLDFDIQRYEDEIAEIKNYMDEQEGQKFNTFLKNLLIWLKSKENIQDVTYDENIALITIRFRNGLDSHISFQYITDNQEESNTSIAYASANNKTAYNYYDVRFEADEQIMKNTKILHIKGMYMSWGPFNTYNEEKECLEKSREQSPVKFEEIRYSSESLDFMENLSDYGLIVISQTHGGGNGSFVVTRPEVLDVKYFYLPSNFVAYVKSGEVKTVFYKSTPVYLIYPSLIAKKLRDSDAIVYANYCWSYYLANYVGNDNTVIGFPMITNYYYNYLFYTSNIFNYILNGITCNKFVKDAVSYEYNISPWWEEEEIIDVYPSLKSPGYQKRYFSISTEEIQEQSAKGNPIIKGRINGYNNLKKNQLDYVVFCHEGPDDFTPDDDDVIKIEIPKDKVNSYGTFNFEIQSDEPLKPATTYRFMFGFEYKGNTYHGETKKFTSSSEPIRAYLEKLYRDTNGDNWTNNTNWCTDAPVEEWYGVSRFLTGPYRINLSDNNLVGSIDLSNCPYIGYLNVGGNDIVDLNLENCSLSELYVEGWRNITYIQSINVSNCKNLSNLGYGYSVKNLKSVVAKNCHKLHSFYYCEGELETLDLSNCVSLGYVHCYQNKLKELTLTGCIELDFLDCSCNYLTELDLSTCTNLNTVYCQENRIKSRIPSYLRHFFENSDYLFVYDNLYDYDVSDFDMSKYGYTQDKNDPVWWYKENEYGWYFPGEPENHGEYTWPE